MLLTVDIGNTTIAFGVFQGRKLKSSWKIPTSSIFSKGKVLKPIKDIDGVIISSVVPKATPIIKKLVRNRFKISPLVLGENIKAPIKNLYRNPKQVGQDRLANAVAASELYGYPIIVVDFGTAITFDIISKRKEYLGGIIIPGIEISLEALSSKAALLPRIKLSLPKEFVGRDTVSSMKSGIFYGFGSLCDGLIGKIKKRYGEQLVIATGGYSRLMAKFCNSMDKVKPDLTFQGLRIIYEWGRSQKGQAI